MSRRRVDGVGVAYFALGILVLLALLYAAVLAHAVRSEQRVPFEEQQLPTLSEVTS